MLDVVQLRELAAVVRRREALELLERLPAEVRAVDEEEDAARVGVLDEAVGDVGGRERLARSRRHLDQRPWAVVGEGALEVANRGDLGRPESLLPERRHCAQAVSERGRARVLRDVREPARERLRPVEGEHLAARRIGVERIGEPRLRSGRLVGERERALDCGRDLVGKAVDVLRTLPLDPGERLALLLRFDDRGCGSVHEEQVVGPSVRGLQDELPHGDTARGREVDRASVLYCPAGRRKHPVDLDAGAGFRG